MRFFAKCLGCQKRRLFIKKHKYSTIHAGIITAKEERCRQCAKMVRIMLGDEIKR